MLYLAMQKAYSKYYRMLQEIPMPTKDENSDSQPIGAPKLSDVEEYESKGDIDSLIKMISFKKFNQLNGDVCQAAFEALARMGPPAVEPLYELYKALPLTEDFLVVNALGKIGAPAGEKLIAILNDWSKPRVFETTAQEIAAAYLGEIGGAPAVNALITALKNIDQPYLQVYATLALGKIGKDAIWPLIDALTNQNIIVRLRATEALGKIGDTRAVGPLIAVLEYYPLGKSQMEFHPGWMGEPASPDSMQLSEAAAIALEQIGWRSSNPLIQSAVEELVVIYDAHHNTGGFTPDSQKARPVEKIGQDLLEQGGIHMMKETHDAFACRNPRSAYHLALIWDRIQFWRRHHENIRDTITYY